MTANGLTLRVSPAPDLKGWLAGFLERNHSARVVSRGRVHLPGTLKPEIGLTGNDGIHIRDEIEMELALNAIVMASRFSRSSL
jgi:hypothetical protein